jgi:uncharacterized membrane protein YcaP (DUF421 family)
MQGLVKVLWHVPAVMLVLLFAGLVMGQRQVGELSVFDLLVGMAMGAVAGAGIVEAHVSHWYVLAAILALGFLHLGVSWAIMKSRWFARLTTFEPLVVVRQGVPLRAAMTKVRLTVADLMTLLRQRDVFDLRDVAYAILETDGQLSVVKTTPRPSQPTLPRAVVVDGQVEVRTLGDLGWNEERLQRELSRLGFAETKSVFVATLDETGQLYVVANAHQPTGPMIKD